MMKTDDIVAKLTTEVSSEHSDWGSDDNDQQQPASHASSTRAAAAAAAKESQQKEHRKLPVKTKTGNIIRLNAVESTIENDQRNPSIGQGISNARYDTQGPGEKTG